MPDNRLIRKLFHLGFLFKRPMTLGVRVLAQNSKGEILLVKHTYVSGWHLPGGGVEARETAVAAAGKEMVEETGYAPAQELKLVGVYYNRHASVRDHVLLFSCNRLEKVEEFQPNREIREIGFFAADRLPEDITGGSARRINEHIHGAGLSEYW